MTLGSLINDVHQIRVDSDAELAELKAINATLSQELLVLQGMAADIKKLVDFITAPEATGVEIKLGEPTTH